MADHKREHEEGKGFWDGGAEAHGNNGESGGRASGAPGERAVDKTGVRTDLESAQNQQEQPLEPGKRSDWQNPTS